MVLAATDPVLLSLTWTGLALAAFGYGRTVLRRSVVHRSERVEYDDAVLRHLVQVLVINDQPMTSEGPSPRP